MTCKRLFLLTMLAAILLPAVSQAHGRYRRPPEAPPARSSTYTVLKGGAYGLTSLPSEGSPDGLYFGLEMGTRPSRFLEIGFAIDWFRRRDGTSEVFLLDTPYDLPVEGVIDLRKTSTDLIPLGGVLRLRFPAGGGHLVPFVSGQVGFDLLRLSASEGTRSGGVILEQTEYFTGIGTSVGGGIEATLDGNAGLLFEAGYHHSRPDKSLEVDGIQVRGRVDASGGYARFGLKFRFR
jgi:hypothetical protein